MWNACLRCGGICRHGRSHCARCIYELGKAFKELEKRQAESIRVKDCTAGNVGTNWQRPATPWTPAQERIRKELEDIDRRYAGRRLPTDVAGRWNALCAELNSVSAGPCTPSMPNPTKPSGSTKTGGVLLDVLAVVAGLLLALVLSFVVVWATTSDLGRFVALTALFVTLLCVRQLRAHERRHADAPSPNPLEVWAKASGCDYYALTMAEDVYAQQIGLVAAQAELAALKREATHA